MMRSKNFALRRKSARSRPPFAELKHSAGSVRGVVPRAGVLFLVSVASTGRAPGMPRQTFSRAVLRIRWRAQRLEGARVPLRVRALALEAAQAAGWLLAPAQTTPRTAQRWVKLAPQRAKRIWKRVVMKRALKQVQGLSKPGLAVRDLGCWLAMAKHRQCLSPATGKRRLRPAAASPRHPRLVGWPCLRLAGERAALRALWKFWGFPGCRGLGRPWGSQGPTDALWLLPLS